MLFNFEGGLSLWDDVGCYELCVKLGNIANYEHKVLDIKMVIVRVGPAEALPLLENYYKITKWCMY